ncbi:hypothetical protein AXW38_03295 [Yersinia ruckeri]|nr:hypothetical protein [Yersinia ruckeri]MCK8585723.1 hypothetical protein [Yersinia ruckeri]MCW6596443.1 hypothetical protein [Yersinia ruckeri]OIX31377.1 hypothetical protein AXW18_03290 [Yersinia ruckeri]OIX31810.1 hypothetical protein AXW19_03285 [Yersinia ruckeri]OIX32133.1 hypothetical protein AXW20_03285 [Yersinia ruckeri]
MNFIRYRKYPANSADYLSGTSHYTMLFDLASLSQAILNHNKKQSLFEVNDKVLAAVKTGRSSRCREYVLVGSFRAIPDADA